MEIIQLGSKILKFVGQHNYSCIFVRFGEIFTSFYMIFMCFFCMLYCAVTSMFSRLNGNLFAHLNALFDYSIYVGFTINYYYYDS